MKDRSTQVKRRGRPRIHERGTPQFYTQLPREVLAAVVKLAKAERRSLAMMISVLVEEGLRARGELR